MQKNKIKIFSFLFLTLFFVLIPFRFALMAEGEPSDFVEQPPVIEPSDPPAEDSDDHGDESTPGNQDPWVPPVATIPDTNKPSTQSAPTPPPPTKLNSTLNVPVGNLGEFEIGGNILGRYLQYWYGFLLGTIGILASVMIMWGGFKYLTSAGDKGKAGEGQAIITSAITSIILAFGVYTILYLVNPKLLEITIPTISSITTKPFDVTKLPGSAGSLKSGNGIGDRSAICSSTNSPFINFEQPYSSSNDCINMQDKEYNNAFDTYGNQYGINPNMLRAIAMAESSGNTNAASKAGACGLMQIKPETARALNNNTPTSCDELKNNPILSIQLAAKYLSTAKKDYGYNDSDLLAGYNGGYGLSARSALSKSQDCPQEGIKAYQCCTNPGELSETQDYIPRVKKYEACYNGL